MRLTLFFDRHITADPRILLILTTDYVLSDPERKAEYDGLRSTQGFQSFTEGEEEKEQDTSANFFSNFFRAAGAAAAAGGSSSSGADSNGDGAGAAQPQGECYLQCRDDSQLTHVRFVIFFAADGVFNNVFEEMLRPEVHRVAPIWKVRFDCLSAQKILARLTDRRTAPIFPTQSGSVQHPVPDWDSSWPTSQVQWEVPSLAIDWERFEMQRAKA